MDRAMIGDMLAGGYIEDYSFDMRRNAFAMRVDVLENGTLSRYDVVFARVSQFSFESETRRGSLEDRLEVTEFTIESGPESSATEEWNVVISMWDTSFLRVRCSSIEVDAEALT